MDRLERLRRDLLRAGGMQSGRDVWRRHIIIARVRAEILRVDQTGKAVARAAEEDRLVRVEVDVVAD